MSTRLALKLGLTLAISFFAVSAVRASAAGVSRIDDDNWNASKISLVSDEIPELSVSPTRHFCSLTLSHQTCPLPDSFEVLNGDRAVSCLSEINDSSRDLMVFRSSVVGLPCSDSLEVTLCGSSAAGLQSTSQDLLFDSVVFDVLSSVGVAFRVYGDLRDAKVNAEHVGSCQFWCVWQLNREQQIEHTLNVDEISLSRLNRRLQLGFLVSTNDNRNHEPAIKRREADMRESFESHDSFVVNNSGTRLELRTDLLVTLEALDGLPDSTNGELSGESVGFSDFAIDQPVDAWLAEDAILESDVSGVIGCLIEDRHCAQKRFFLRVVWQEFDFDSQLHVAIFIERNCHRSTLILSSDETTRRRMKRTSSISRE